MRKNKNKLWLVIALAFVLALSCFVGCGDKNDPPPTEPTYTVTVTGGTASKTKAESGEVITLTATPQIGEEFKEWVVKSGDITIADNKFTMPASDVNIEAAFQKISYTVTVDGGTANKSTAYYGDTVTLTVGDVPAGKEFVTWKLNGTAFDGDSFKMPAGNATVVAEYRNIRYDVTVNGGTADKAKAEAGETVTLTPADAELGKEFKSWTVVAGDITVTDNTFTMPAGDVEVTAVYVFIDYTVTVTDGSADKTTAHYGETVTLTHDADAIPDGKEFGGWIVNDVFQEGNTFTMPAGNVTVTPKYTGHQYNIVVAGGTSNRTKAEAGETVTLTPADAELGKEFKSWTVVAGDITVTDNTFTMPASDVEVTAVFGFVDYTITVTGGSADKMTAHYGDTVTLTVDETAIPQGKVFTEWKVDGEAIDGNTFTMPAANVEVVAEYGNESYKITVSGGTADKTKAEMGETVTLTPDTAQAGYEFKGWKVDGAAIDGNTFEMPAADVTVEVVFGKIEYEIFVTGGTADPEKATVGDTVTLTPNAPAAGMEFKSWQVLAGDTTITDNTFVMPAEEVEIKAVFGYIEYTVTVVGGTANKSTAHYGDEITLTPDSKPGYEFKNWNVTAGDVTITDNKFTVNCNVTVEAVFEHIEYTVTVVGGTADKQVAYYGETVTLTSDALDVDKVFYRWEVNGTLQEDDTFVMPAANVEAKAVVATITKISTSVGAVDFIYREASGTVATERNGTAFGPVNAKDSWTMEYVKYYIYDSATAVKPLGYLIVDTNGANDANNGSYKSSDGKYSIVRHGPPNAGWGNGGGGEFFALLKYELGTKYCAGRTYYFAVQAVAKQDHVVKVGDEWVKYVDSDISAICTYSNSEGKLPIVEDATKPADPLTITVENGKINGSLTSISAGYGSTITLNAEVSETQLFAGWRIGDRVISYNYDCTYAVDVEEDSTVTALFVEEGSDLVSYVQTPAASNDHIRKLAGGAIEFDRSNGGTGTFFRIPGLDHIKYYVYESPDATEPIGAFKFFLAETPLPDSLVGCLGSLDGTIVSQIVRGNGGKEGGNYYTDGALVDSFFSLLKYELGGRYADGKTYYFAIQACTDSVRTILRDGEISAISTVGFSRNSSAVTECTVTVESGADGVDAATYQAFVGSTFVLNATIPEGKTVVWYKVVGDSLEYVGMGNGLRAGVNGDTVFRPVFVTDGEVKRLDTPDNTGNAMIKFSGALIEYDRQKNEDGSKKTAFTDDVDYLLVHIYTDANKSNHVGQFMIIRKDDKFYLSHCEGYGSFTDWEIKGGAGNLYTEDGNAHNRIKEAIIGYSTSIAYYYAFQAIPQAGSDFIASEIGAVGSGWTAI